MNNTAKQKALDYIMYMILGSYFTKAVCKSPIREKQLLLYYKDLKPTDQVDLENLCIRYIEKFKNAVPEDFWKQEMEVHFQGRFANVIRLQSDKHILLVRTEYKGKKSAFQIRLLTKKEHGAEQVQEVDREKDGVMAEKTVDTEPTREVSIKSAETETALCA